MFAKITQSLHELGQFDETNLSLFKERLEVVHIQKGKYLLAIGDVCSEFYFLQKGSFRHYHTTSEYFDVTANLFVATDWVLDHNSFTSRKPSLNKIEAFEDSILYKMSIDQIHELIGISPAFFALGRILEKVAFNNYHQNTKDTPEDKYRTLLSERPNIIQTFPLKHIASYLGMTPETLSRVRRKLAEK